MGMSGSKPVGTPGVKVTSEQLAQDKDLSHQRQRPYRGGGSQGQLPFGRPSGSAARGEGSVQMDVDADTDSPYGAEKGGQAPGRT